MKNAKSVIQFAILLGIGILLIWLSLRQVAPQKDKILNAFRQADYFWIFVSLLISILSHFLRAFRWNYLLKPVGYRTNLLNATCEVFVGYFANYGIPRMGEISRCTLAARYDKVPFEIAIGTVITERIVDFFLLIVIFFLTLLTQFNEFIGLANYYVFDKVAGKFAASSGNVLMWTLVAGGLLVLVIFVMAMRKRIANLLKGKLGGIVKGMAEGIGSIRKMDRPVQFILLSVAIWLCYFYSLYFCFFALSGTSELGAKECMTLLLLGTFGVIFTPGGLGAYPLILYGILHNTYHIDEASSFALPWMSWGSQFVMILAMGIVSLIVLPIYNNKHVVPPAARG